ncbi:hypothetical protein DL93DRAFT_1248739 [Clavulina sp. PMI_390]|nr:hypothetical protein DL93DRAFT_1248739 [Clavulina sp. PMI_390]
MQSLVEARKTAVGPPLISSSKHEGGVKLEQTESSAPVSLHTTLVAAFLATPAESSHKRSPSPGNAGIPVSTGSRALDVAPFTTPHPVAPTRQDASQNAGVGPLDSLASSPINAHASGSVPPTQPEKENLKPRKSRAQRQAASKAKEIARASGQPTMSPTSPPTPAGVIHLPTAPADVENNINESASPLEESPTIEPKIAMMDPTLVRRILSSTRFLTL